MDMELVPLDITGIEVYYYYIIIIIIIMEYTPVRGVQDTEVITSRLYNKIKTLCTRNCANYIFIS